jgi:hypothetical protein
LTVPALLCAVRVVDGRKSRAIAALFVLLALAAQVHQAALFFGVVLVAVSLADVRTVSWRAAVIGLAIATLIVAPYATSVLEIVRGAGGFSPRTGSAWPDIDVVTNLLLDASGHNIIQSAGEEAGWMLLWPFPPFGLLVHLAAIPFYAYFFAGLAQAKADATIPRGLRRLLLGLVLGVPALYLVLRVNGVAHYFLPIFPVLFALVVLGGRRLRASVRWRRFAVPLPALVGVNVLSWLVFQSYEAAHFGSEQYGLPYRRLVEACDDVRDAAHVLGKGRPGDPLVLRVDIPRERGVIPASFRYVLGRRLGLDVRAAEAGEVADVVLTVRWPHPGRLTTKTWTLAIAPSSGGEGRGAGDAS